MKKVLLFFAVLLAASSYALAQGKQTAPPNENKVNYNGYTIHIRPALAGGYGYLITKGNEMVAKQEFHPFTMAPKGLEKHEDVVKLAKWQADQLKAQELKPPSQNASQTQKGQAGGTNKQRPQPPSMERYPQLNAQQARRRGPVINHAFPVSLAKELNIQEK